MNESNDLSDRELEILKLVATGASNKEIAQKLFISLNTVKVHLRNIFAKIGVASRTEAAMYSVKIGLVSTPTLTNETSLEEDSESDRPLPEGIFPTSKIITGSAVRPYWLNGLLIAAAIAVIVLGLSVLMVIRNQRASEVASAVQSQPAQSERWKNLTPMPTARFGLAVAVVDNQVYAIAGETDQGVTGVVEKFDPSSNLWTERASKPTPVSDASAAVTGGEIYIPGGRLVDGSVTNINEIYNPRENRWKEAAPMPTALSAFANVAFEGKLYLFGGWDGKTYVDSVYRYDPELDEWIELSPMPTARGFAGAVVVGEKVYVFGGFNEKKTLAVNEVYSPSLDGTQEKPWETGVPLPAGISAMSAANLGEIIHVMGGESTQPSGLTMLEFFPQQKKWQVLDGSVDQPWSHLGLAPLGTRLILVGGKLNGVPTDQVVAYQALYTYAIPLVP